MKCLRLTFTVSIFLVAGIAKPNQPYRESVKKHLLTIAIVSGG
jgi:hypothetical protein